MISLRSTTCLVACLALVTALSACGGASPSSPQASTAEAAPPAGGQTVVTATFPQPGTADNYDKALVPDGAKLLVAENVFDGETTVTLSVRHLLPNPGVRGPRARQAVRRRR